MADRIRNRIRSNVVVLAASLTVGVLALLTLAPAALAQMFSAPTNFAAGDSANSVAVGDFNADSDPDLAVANGDCGQRFRAARWRGRGLQRANQPRRRRRAPYRSRSATSTSMPIPIWRSPTSSSGERLGAARRRGGHLRRPNEHRRAGDAPNSVTVGDFNADSDPDLAIADNGFAGDPGAVWVALGGADGSFGEPTSFIAGNRPESVAVGDFDADTNADLAVANFESDDVSVLLGDGAGSFGPPTDFAAGDEPVSVAVTDFNGDGDPDLAVANFNSGNVSVRLGDAGANFGAAEQLHRRRPARLGRDRSASTPTPTPIWRSPTPAPTTCR